MLDIHADFIIDDGGQRKAVQLPIAEWENILSELEELDDLRTYDEAKRDSGPFVPLEQGLNSIDR